jgi:hypothetical protein
VWRGAGFEVIENRLRSSWPSTQDGYVGHERLHVRLGEVSSEIIGRTPVLVDAPEVRIGIRTMEIVIIATSSSSQED